MTKIGDRPFKLPRFENVETLLAELKKYAAKDQIDTLFSILLKLIQKAPEQAFLLSAVIDYLKKANETGLFRDPVTFAFFEFWLNQKANLTQSEHFEVRAKIVGKKIPRQDYQLLFPIGLGNTFTGSHFVVAHRSPDIDTTVSSFLGWLDAFGAKLCSGLHHWSLPSGPPTSGVTRLLEKQFGPEIFTLLAKQNVSLSLTSLDLISNQNVFYLTEETEIRSIDHGANEKALILVGKNGQYLGNFRTSDIERVDQVIRLIDFCFEKLHESLTNTLIDSFGEKKLKPSQFKKNMKHLFSEPLEKSIPDDRQCQFKKFFEFALNVKETHFNTIAKALEKQGFSLPLKLVQTFDAIDSSPLFEGGQAVNDRSTLFSALQTLTRQSQECLRESKQWIEKLSNALIIKEHVLQIHSQTLSLKSSVDEIRAKISTSGYLTVLFEQNGIKIPLGVVWAEEVRKQELGTASFRDFCNREEVSMASYLSLISAIDHHKSEIETTTAPSLTIADTQSTNVLIAEKLFQINDNYSTLGQSKTGLEEQLEQKLSPYLQMRLLQRCIAEKQKGRYWIDDEREFIEFILITHAILDDTDLLSKVTPRDLMAVIELINRMKTLTIQKESLLIAYDDIPKDTHFATTLARRILSNEEMYSLYRKITQEREKVIENELLAVKRGKVDALLSDTKEQNRCARIGQIKLFAKNQTTLMEVFESIVTLWKQKSEAIYSDHPEIDFHLLMISTIPSADEVKEGIFGHWKHKDDLIIWIPQTQVALEHLSLFLNRWKELPEVSQNQFQLKLWGSDPLWYEEIFRRNFFEIEIIEKIMWKDLPEVAILSFQPGSLNSRKAMISPFLPKLIV